MVSAWRFRVKTPDVVHEVIDGEAVIVNLSSGMYYSVDRAGVDIWTMLEQGTTVPDIMMALTARYKGDRAEIESGVDRFIKQLEAERLIVPDSTQQDAPSPSNPVAAPKGERPRFEAPNLEHYSDMEDLLLLDPIHDSDDRFRPR